MPGTRRLALYAIVVGTLGTMPGISYSAPDAFYEPEFLWPKQDVTVCFGTQEQIPRTEILDPKKAGLAAETLDYFRAFPPEVRTLIRSSIEAEYTRERTGIRFVGWNDCDPAALSDVVLLGFSAPSESKAQLGYIPLGRASIGTSAWDGTHKLDPSLKAFVFFDWKEAFGNAVSVRDFKHAVLHEFGHVAGLRHNHVSSDYETDPFCIHSRAVSRVEKPGPRTMSYGAYDPFSIMSYCLSEWGWKNGSAELYLSDEDIEKLPAKKVDPTVLTPVPFRPGVFRWTVTLSVLDRETLRTLYPPKKTSSWPRRMIHK